MIGMLGLHGSGRRGTPRIAKLIAEGARQREHAEIEPVILAKLVTAFYLGKRRTTFLQQDGAVVVGAIVV